MHLARYILRAAAYQRCIGVGAPGKVPWEYHSGAAVLRAARSAVGNERQTILLEPKGEAGPEATVCQGEAKWCQVPVLKWH